MQKSNIKFIIKFLTFTILFMGIYIAINGYMIKNPDNFFMKLINDYPIIELIMLVSIIVIFTYNFTKKYINKNNKPHV